MMRFLILLLFAQTAHAQLADGLLDIQTEYDLLGGTLVVFCADELAVELPFGTANVAQNRPVTDSTLFRIASISKTVTAIAVHQLVEDGALELDADIGGVLDYAVRNPNFPDQPITARHLLSHTSGLVDGSTYGSFLNATFGNPVPPLANLLQPTGSYYSTSNFLNQAPGTYFSYSNLNYGILGTLVEAASGQRFDHYVRAEILDPLGVAGHFNPALLPDVDQVATLYRKPNGVWTPQSDNFSGTAPNDAPANYLPGTNAFRFAPQGGLRVSGAGLARIFQEFLRPDPILLEATTIDTLFAAAWTDDGTNGNNYYGLFRSWGLGVHRITQTPDADMILPNHPDLVGHPGEAYGLISDAYVDRAAGFGFVFMTNGSGVGYNVPGNSAWYEVERAVFDLLAAAEPSALCATVSASNPVLASPVVSVQPVPARSEITLRIAEDLLGSEALLFDATGRLVDRWEPHGRRSERSVAQLSSGVYVLRVGAAATRLVVVR